MFAVIYRWRLNPAKETQFRMAWAEATALIREHRGGLGSRLHQTSEGDFLAYAQWPSQEAWERSGAIELPPNSAFEKMKDAALSAHPPLTMHVIANLLADLTDQPQTKRP